MMKQIIYILLLLLFFPDASCRAAAAQDKKTLSFQGKASAQIMRTVSVPFAMQVEDLLVSVGSLVDKDAPLLSYTLLPQDARAQQSLLSGKETALLSTREQLAALGRETLHAGHALRRDSELAEQGLAPRAEVQQSAAAVGALKARKELLQFQLAANQRDYDLLLAELNGYFGSALKPGDVLPKVCRLTAPIAGTVIEMAGAARPGGFVAARAAAATIAVLDPIQAEVQVHESEIGRLRKGDQVEVEVPNLGGRKFPGHIVALSWNANDMAIAMPSFYIITIDIENKGNVIRPGYKVWAHVGHE